MIKVFLIALATAVLGVIPFMGIPGAVVLFCAKPATNLLYGPLAFEHWMINLGDRSWPMAIMLSIVWPVLIPIAYFIAMRTMGGASFFTLKPMSVFGAVILVGCAALSQIAVSSSGTIKRLSRQEIVQTAILAGKIDYLKRYYQPEDLGSMRVDPLQEAIFNRKTEMAAFLIDSRSDLSRYYPEGDQTSVQFATPMHTAVNVGSVEILRMLVRKNADPNVKNALGQTPLHAQSWDPDGDGTVLDIMREAGADFNAVDSAGNTPLISLTNVLNQWEQMPVYARKMIEAGTNPQHRNSEGKSALDFARQNHHQSTVDFLERQGKTEPSP